MRKHLRALQTLFPFLHDFRFSLKLLSIKIFKTPHENDFNALKMFNPDSTQVFIDIGSNRGEGIQSTLIFSKFSNPIIGFEPNPLIFNKLKDYFISNKRVLVHNCGLGDADQELSLFVPFYRKWMFDGLSSFKYDEAKNWLRTRLWGYKEQLLSIKELNCKIRKLDDFQLNPYFIKIDVQGFELEVLNGGQRTIATSRPIFLIETINHEVASFLSQYDYDFFYFENGKLIKGEGKLNTFCITPEKYRDLSN